MDRGKTPIPEYALKKDVQDNAGPNLGETRLGEEIAEDVEESAAGHDLVKACFDRFIQACFVHMRTEGDQVGLRMLAIHERLDFGTIVSVITQINDQKVDLGTGWYFLQSVADTLSPQHSKPIGLGRMLNLRIGCQIGR